MKAVILAAGIGTRMGNMGKNIPKCLIEIKGKTLLERQIEVLEKTGFKKEDITIVTGSQGLCWTDDNNKRIREIHCNIIVNNRNVELNQAYSFLVGISSVEESSILVADGDLLASESLVKDIVSFRDTALLTKTPEQKDEPGNRVALDDGRVHSVSRNYEGDNFRIYSGMFFIAEKDFMLFRNESENERYHSLDLGFLLDSVCKKTVVSSLNRNSGWININTPELIKKAEEIISS